MDNPFENSDNDSARPDKDGLGNDLAAKDAAVTGVVPGHTAMPSGDEERASIITARGTAEGLVLRIDARVEAGQLKTAVAAFVESRRSFLGGNEIALEWVGAKPDEFLVQDLSALLERKFEITVRTSRMRPQVSRQPTETDRVNDQASRTEIGSRSEIGSKVLGEVSSPFSVVAGSKTTSRSAQSANPPSLNSRSNKPISLFDGIESLDDRSGGSASGLLWDEPDARVVYTTLRSGQKIETEHSVIIFGDVNSGAEVIAGGDIIVLGTLRGIAHAGAYDETGGGRVIFCLNMQPTQLRIGTVISRGLNDDRTGEPNRSSEIARVQNNLIVVEAYQSRAVWGRRRG